MAAMGSAASAAVAAWAARASVIKIKNQFCNYYASENE